MNEIQDYERELDGYSREALIEMIQWSDELGRKHAALVEAVEKFLNLEAAEKAGPYEWRGSEVVALEAALAAAQEEA